MKPAEMGYLLLCCRLGQDERPLTLRQMGILRKRIAASPEPKQPEQKLTLASLRSLGFSLEDGTQILRLLNRREALESYLSRAEALGIVALSCNSPRFPPALRNKLRDLCPPVIFCRGNLSLLREPCVSLVGSRQLTVQGQAFACRVGELAAKEGLTLVSGNAGGADRTAQQACLYHGGAVISVLADALSAHAPENDRVLYLCQEGWELPFTAVRALSRNRLIHALGDKVLVAQTRLGAGGTWSGTEENLRHGYSPVFVHSDNSAGAIAMARQGATPVTIRQLSPLRGLTPAQTAFL